MAKIGEGSVAAYGRTGLNEFRNLIYPESNVAQKHVEYGMWGHPTPGEVAASRSVGDQSLEQELPSESILESRMRQSEQRAPAKESREPVMDR